METKTSSKWMGLIAGIGAVLLLLAADRFGSRGDGAGAIVTALGALAAVIAAYTAYERNMGTDAR